jgi:hypothetical protein
MEILLFALGILLVIVGLPICFSCEIQAVLRKRSKNKTSQKEETIYQNAIVKRSLGLVLIIIGVVLIILSFAGIAV